MEQQIFNIFYSFKGSMDQTKNKIVITGNNPIMKDKELLDKKGLE